ncbi:uncharacterized protein LOC108699370 isoform X2 [Xenopus laevis]|uniref:Uncharacterized protein LOC108699370 isoform X2 n=1 Tax=Xenopus laevis TaxID=8355 RepID=A0A8J1LIP8_XENLA|nr:uncharacterized protein LOC108699370 isoform X2 [Xenopus laevis]
MPQSFPDNMFWLISYFFLTLSFTAAANQNVPLQVIGFEKHSAFLKNRIDMTVPMDEILWLFKTKEKQVRLADFSKPYFEIRFPQFNNRLEPLDDGTIRINDLRMEDSGIYTAAITFINHETKRLTFNLTVYANQDAPLQVNGLQKHSVYLKNRIDMTVPMDEIQWLFKTKEKEVRLADFKKTYFETRFPQFNKRLEPLDDGTIRINDLRMEDSGIYTAAITFIDHETKRLTFNLTVYEPVPTPNIWIEKKKRTTQWCNFTIRCSVQNNDSALTFTWINKHNQTEYETFINGTIFVASVESPTLDKEFHCLLGNPVDQKNASIHVLEICPTPVNSQRMYLLFIPAFIILILLLVWLAVARKKRKKNCNRKSADKTAGERRVNHEPSLGFDNSNPNITEHMPDNNSEETQYILVGASPRMSSVNPEVQSRSLCDPKLNTLYSDLRNPVCN